MKKLLLCLTITTTLVHQVYSQDMQDVKIEIVPAGENIYMLTGQGGNIGVSVGEDGVFMIDDQFAPLSKKILEAVKTLSDKPVKFLVNTHFHGDHTGGNLNFEEQGALIVAHENVRKHLMADSKESGLPIITYETNVIFHLNGNDILATHVHNAHTDSDSLIYFPQSNVLHTGDTFFNGSFPYIDLNNGGSVAGDIEAGKAGLMLINENTTIIPGHGAIATYADYKTYIGMLESIRDNVQKAIDENKNKEEIASMEELTSSFYTDEQMKNSFINGKKIRETFFDSLTSQTK